MVRSSCWKVGQFALSNCLRGPIGIRMGLVEMVIMIGMWSEAVSGPEVKRILWKIRELRRTMAGEVEQLLRIRVGKLGPIGIGVL